MTRVLVVDDSPTQRLSIRRILESDPEVRVVGEGSNGEDAILLRRTLRPDIITMDIHMPKVDGLEAIARIMAEDPCPIVVLIGYDYKTKRVLAKSAIEAGALLVQDKPDWRIASETAIKRYVSQIRMMADVKVVGRRRKAPIVHGVVDKRRPRTADNWTGSPDIVAIGTSTGGPPALQTILAGLSPNIPPVVIVQHISPGFLDGLAQWLNDTVALDIVVASRGDVIQSGKAYLAPDGAHMRISRGGRIILSETSPIGGHLPAVNVMFESVAQSYGANSVGVLLTGMGIDGAAGLHSMRTAGAYTIVQDEASSVVFGMGRAAVNLGAACRVLPLARIPSCIGTLVDDAQIVGDSDEIEERDRKRGSSGTAAQPSGEGGSC